MTPAHDNNPTFSAHSPLNAFFVPVTGEAGAGEPLVLQKVPSEGS